MSIQYKDNMQVDVRTGSQTAGASPKHDKHQELALAIDKIDEIIDYTRELIARLEGNPTEAPRITGGITDASFVDVLNNSPEAIKDRCETLKDLICKLTQLLF